jgi:hypothetical protein
VALLLLQVVAVAFLVYNLGTTLLESNFLPVLFPAASLEGPRSPLLRPYNMTGASLANLADVVSLGEHGTPQVRNRGLPHSCTADSYPCIPSDLVLHGRKDGVIQSTRVSILSSPLILVIVSPVWRARWQAPCPRRPPSTWRRS